MVDSHAQRHTTVATYERRVTASMLWAAWADAVGFISELTDESGLRHRTHGAPLTGTLEWTRRVGGRYGVAAELPAGTYSDDTQLRLAAARSISSHGFDVEAFARIELPVWPAYALGGGRASRAAATGMSKSNATWHTNFYDGWTKAGGNGAAMRIQPHVWAAGYDDTYIAAVIRDAIVTHGHPRALIGAVLHAIALAYSLRQPSTPPPSRWGELLKAARGAIRFFRADSDLWTIWVPSWERAENRSFEQAWDDTADECAVLLDSAAHFVEAIRDTDAPAIHSYTTLIEHLGLRDPKTIGSGTATVIAALALAAAFPDNPEDATLLAAHALGTDTDTIGTMAAALIGATSANDHLPSPVQDEEYLRDEASRLARIAAGEPTRSFSYPDTLRWKPPQSQLDVVGLADGRIALAGIGWLEMTGPSYPARDAVWTWARSELGVSVLIKHRPDMRALPQGNWPSDREIWHATATATAPPVKSPRPSQPTLFDAEPEPPRQEQPPTTATPALSLDAILSALTHTRIDDDTLGRIVREVTEEGDRDQLGILVGAIWSHFHKA